MTDEKVIERYRQLFKKWPTSTNTETFDPVEQFILTTLKQYKEELMKEIELNSTTITDFDVERIIYVKDILEIIKKK